MSYSVGSAGFAGGKLEADIPALTYPSCEQMTIGEDWEATAAKKKGRLQLFQGHLVTFDTDRFFLAHTPVQNKASLRPSHISIYPHVKQELVDYRGQSQTNGETTEPIVKYQNALLAASLPQTCTVSSYFMHHEHRTPDRWCHVMRARKAWKLVVLLSQISRHPSLFPSFFGAISYHTSAKGNPQKNG